MSPHGTEHDWVELVVRAAGRAWGSTGAGPLEAGGLAPEPGAAPAALRAQGQSGDLPPPDLPALRRVVGEGEVIAPAAAGCWPLRPVQVAQRLGGGGTLLGPTRLLMLLAWWSMAGSWPRGPAPT